MLREAFTATIKDPALIEEAHRLKLELDPLDAGRFKLLSPAPRSRPRWSRVPAAWRAMTACAQCA